MKRKVSIFLICLVLLVPAVVFAAALALYLGGDPDWLILLLIGVFLVLTLALALAFIALFRAMLRSAKAMREQAASEGPAAASPELALSRLEALIHLLFH